MLKNERINILSFIGEKFADVINDNPDDNFPKFENIKIATPWFTEEFVRYSLTHWAKLLTDNNINKWLNNYDNIPENPSDKTLGLIFAGNIPLVGLHDLLCALVCGCKINIKLSEKDKILNKWIIDELIKEFDYLKNSITVSEKKLENFDLIIATGSNNSFRYFDYYFNKYPKVLRKNKNSIGIITGNESAEELNKLADDIFLYFGLGCRSVSKILVPQNYDFEKLIKAFKKYEELKYHNKYANNYDYRKAIFQMNKVPYIDSENLLLTMSKELASPISVLHYSHYKNENDCIEFVNNNADDIQCIVSNKSIVSDSYFFGQSQKPELNTYADNIDIIKFLIKNI